MKNTQTENQIFLQSPDLQIPTHALTLNPNLTLRDLKLSLLPFQILESSFFFNGKPLPNSSMIQNSQIITPSSTLTLRFRLPGGGGDGCSTFTESRDCYLNMYASKKSNKVDPNKQRLSRWLNCALSNEPLKHPVVVDLIGEHMVRVRFDYVEDVGGFVEVGELLVEIGAMGGMLSSWRSRARW